MVVMGTNDPQLGLDVLYFSTTSQNADLVAFKL